MTNFKRQSNWDEKQNPTLGFLKQINFKYRIKKVKSRQIKKRGGGVSYKHQPKEKADTDILILDKHILRQDISTEVSKDIE